jgi:UMF1 family MFS transporter
MNSKKNIFFKNLHKWTNAKRWIAYDWANSVFATSVASAFFPIMLRNYWGKGLKPEDVTLYLGLASSFTSLILSFSLPFLGHAIDQKFKFPQRALFFTAFLGGAMTASLAFVNEGAYHFALSIYVLAFILFALGNTQCDGMLLKLEKDMIPKRLNQLSSHAYLFGYLGGGVLLILQALVLIFHKSLGFDSTLIPAKLCFFTAGLWWVAFSLPLLKIKNLTKIKQYPVNFFENTASFLKSLNKKTIYFLAGFFLYIDVIFTMYKMAVDFGLAIGLSQNHLIMVLIYVQIVGVPGTLFMNWIAERFKIQKALYFGIFCYATVVVTSPFVQDIASFTFLATFIGLSQGGMQALSRSHFSRLIPKDKQGLGFGFLNVFGKISAILGPIAVGVTAKALGGNTYSVLSLFPFLVFGAFFLHMSFKSKLSE